MACPKCDECAGEVQYINNNRGFCTKKCPKCGHRWTEEIPKPAVEIVKGGWVRFNDER